MGVAVSGGADSVALLLLLNGLRDTLGIRLVAIHFNHQLRGQEAERDEQFVRELAGTIQCEFIGGSDDVASRARERGWNLEDAGRRLRYQFFADLVRDRRAGQVAVAHTADDQAETVLAQIIRGTGPTGLAGIYPVAGTVIRPLLEVRRGALRDFLTAVGQPWREDSTNQDETRLRARIRNRLIPSLETNFQPAITGHLARWQVWREKMNPSGGSSSRRSFERWPGVTMEGFASPSPACWRRWRVSPKVRGSERRRFEKACSPNSGGINGLATGFSNATCKM